MKNENNISMAVLLWEKISRSYDTFKKKKVSVVTAHGLTLPQYHLLEMLYINGTMPLKNMAKETLVTPANITCVIDNLESSGLVMRIPVKNDRRRILAKLTSKGRKKIEKIIPEQQKEIEVLVNLLTKEEQQVLNKILSKYI